MSTFRKNQYSIDNGQYSRKRNPSSGKAEGVEKRAIELGRNEMCLCGSKKKYKHCCLTKGFFFVKSEEKKLKVLRWTVIKIRIKRFFKIK